MKVTLRIGLLTLVAFLGYTYFNASLSSHNAPPAHENANLKADVIVFSFDRPLQLYAFLESMQRYVTGLGTVQVIYRASDDAFAQAYASVQADFGGVSFMRQGSNPRADFKPLTVQALVQSPHAYVLFAVDDIIVIDHIDCCACIQALEKYKAYGFYLRLGTNLRECYTMSRAQQLPKLQMVEPGMFKWCFAQAEFDWNYPNTVDMTLYRKRDIDSQFKQMQYGAPNPLEGTWSTLAKDVMQRTGLCYEYTKIINVPLNSVQSDWTNRNMEFMTVKQLLAIFKEGKKMDINPLYQIRNISAHMAYIPTFIERV